MSKHSLPRSSSGPLRYVAVLLCGAALGGTAWFFLVRAAIDFGLVARAGDRVAWLFMVAAALGATVCLLLVLALLARTLAAVGLVGDQRPRRVAGRRRAG